MKTPHPVVGATWDPASRGERLELIARQMRPPGRGDCWILKIAHAASPKNLSKNGLPQKGVSLSAEGGFEKNFQVREKIPPTTFGGCSHACGEAFNSRRLVSVQKPFLGTKA